MLAVLQLLQLLLLCSCSSGFALRVRGVGVGPRPAAALTRAPRLRLSAAGDAPPSDAQTLLQLTASRLKVVAWGKGASSDSQVTASVESKSPRFRDDLLAVTLSRKGGLGLELVEMDTMERTRFGLVLVGGVGEGSNAAAPISGSFAVGDALVSIEGVKAAAVAGGDLVVVGESKRSVEGLDFDATVDVLSSFGEYDVLRVVVKRLVERKVVTVNVCGPDGKPYTELKVLSGLGANLRTILQASNVNMYASATARFDSPYESGNCGGEGTCGTCCVAVMSGADKLNARVRVEDKALKIQARPPNYRWACRTLVAEDKDAEGEVKIRLRPQTNL